MSQRPSTTAILPSDKFDEGAVLRLDKKPTNEWATHAADLLSWIQDINWPIARPVIDLLRKAPAALVGPIRDVLAGDDDEWQHNCLLYLVAEMPLDTREQLRPDLERFRDAVSPQVDRDWDMRELIDGILGTGESEDKAKQQRMENTIPNELS